jgi:hypothetical protein
LGVQHSAGQTSFFFCSSNRLQNLPQVASSALQALKNTALVKPSTRWLPLTRH